MVKKVGSGKGEREIIETICWNAFIQRPSTDRAHRQTPVSSNITLFTFRQILSRDISDLPWCHHGSYKTMLVGSTSSYIEKSEMPNLRTLPVWVIWLLPETFCTQFSIFDKYVSENKIAWCFAFWEETCWLSKLDPWTSSGWICVWMYFEECRSTQWKFQPVNVNGGQWGKCCCLCR